MNTETLLDYPTLLAHQARPVHLALRLEAEALVEDQPTPPAAFCLVLDASGSMRGEPLAHARQAAAQVVRHLRGEDSFALVVFENEARTVIPLQTAEARHRVGFTESIARITDGGATNLTAGWMLGRDALREAPTGMRRRLLLLSDGHLNQGITEPDQVRQLVVRGCEQDGIRTACLGFGGGYDEDLLVSLARATHGDFHDASSPEKIPAVVAAELEGLQRVVVQNLRVRMRKLDFCDALEALGDHPWVLLPDGRVEFALGDLVAGEQRVVCFALQVLPLPWVDGRPAYSLEGEELLGLELLYDDIRRDGVASQTFTQTVRVRATQDPGEVRPNGEVVQWVALQRSGRVAEHIARLMDDGNAREALNLLDQSLMALAGLGAGEGVAEARRQFEQWRGRIDSGRWDARERKMAMYRALSHQRMSSATAWCLDGEKPSYKRPRRPESPGPAPQA